MTDVEEISKDLADLRTLLTQAQRENSKTLIQRDISRLERVQEQAQAAARIHE